MFGTLLSLPSPRVENHADYLDDGLHNWGTCMRNLDADWEYLKPSLQG